MESVLRTLDAELLGWPLIELEPVVIDGLQGAAPIEWSEALAAWARERQVGFARLALRPDQGGRRAMEKALPPLDMIIAFGRESDLPPAAEVVLVD